MFSISFFLLRKSCSAQCSLMKFRTTVISPTIEGESALSEESNFRVCLENLEHAFHAAPKVSGSVPQFS